jgi:hypothetical protein
MNILFPTTASHPHTHSPTMVLAAMRILVCVYSVFEIVHIQVKSYILYLDESFEYYDLLIKA